MRTGWRLRNAIIGLLAAYAVTLGVPFPAAATDLPGVLTDYTITSWGQRDGFPLGSTWAIAQDEDGYLWLGTDAGLFRVDGVRFLPWAPPDADPPLRGSVRSLLSARDGSLWIGFGDAGRAVRVHGGRPRIYGEAEGLPGVAVTTFLEDGDG